MSTHTDLIYVYELTKKALENIKDLEKSMKIYGKKNITRKKQTRKKKKNNIFLGERTKSFKKFKKV